MTAGAESGGLGIAVFSGATNAARVLWAGTKRAKRRSGICPLCAFLLGRQFAVGTTEFQRFSPPVHPNCVHYWRFRRNRSFRDKDFRWPSPTIIRKHGFFVVNPQRMRDLDIPAGTSAKDFQVITKMDPKTGQRELAVKWKRKRKKRRVYRDTEPVQGE